MSLEQDLHNLSQVPLFEAFETEALRILAFSAETRLLRAGDLLFSKGEPSDGGYVVLSGSIALSPSDAPGPEDTIVSPFALIGEIALISATERASTATALEPAAVLKISRALFHRILNEYPQSAMRIRGIISSRLSDFVRQLDEVRVSSFSG